MNDMPDDKLFLKILEEVECGKADQTTYAALENDGKLLLEIAHAIGDMELAATAPELDEPKKVIPIKETKFMGEVIPLDGGFIPELDQPGVDSEEFARQLAEMMARDDLTPPKL